MRSSAGPEEPVSVADLLGRHGQVLTERGAPLPVPAPRRPLSGRMRRTLVAVGSVLAAGSVLGGAVAVTTTGHDTPLGRSPGSLFDQRDPAGTGGATGGVPDPRAPAVGAPAERIGSAAATGAVPQPRSAPAAPPAPAASTAPHVVVVPQARPAEGAGTEDRSAPVPTGRAVAPSVRDTAPTNDIPGSAVQAPTVAPAADDQSSGGGLVGNVVDTVGGLLGG
jgi:hypothetical protein